jgi:hypothetical protein
MDYINYLNIMLCIYNYLQKLVSNTISISEDVRVFYK